MESRAFQLDSEWSVIYYPEQPKGFGILIIGDIRSFVSEKSSFWSQNERRLKILNELKKSGYTSMYSNMFGSHWGSEKAVQLAKSLYEYMRRHEILNEKIHILAEGMGALVALRLMAELKNRIRSVVFINPILSLRQQLELEKEHKFFYKKMLVEISSAYAMKVEDVLTTVMSEGEMVLIPQDIPVKVICLFTGGREYERAKLIVKQIKSLKNENDSISVSMMLPEKEQHLARNIVAFFQQHELEL